MGVHFDSDCSRCDEEAICRIKYKYKNLIRDKGIEDALNKECIVGSDIDFWNMIDIKIKCIYSERGE